MPNLVQNLSLLAARSAAFSKFLSLLERVDQTNPFLLRVLTYHRIDQPGTHPELAPGLISATPEDFQQQMEHLAAHYHVVSMQDVLSASRNRTELPSRAVLVTFDDAYHDFAQHAWPVLKRYGLPVSLFVATSFPDHPERTFWWDQLHQGLYATDRREPLKTPVGLLPMLTSEDRRRAYSRLRDHVKSLPHEAAMGFVRDVSAELNAPPARHHVLDWDSLRWLAAEGVTLGAHTRTHPLMNRVSIDEAVAEAGGSLRDLRRQIGSVLPIFAYPSGGFNDEVVRALKREGFVLAFTTGRGINDLRTADPLRLRRINIGQRTNQALLRAQLHPWSVHLNRWLSS